MRFITWVPLAVMLLEPHRARLRVTPFLALGVVVSAYLRWVVLANPVEVVRHAYELEYLNVVQHPLLWAVLYIVAVIGAPLMSRYRSIVAFGALNLVGLVHRWPSSTNAFTLLVVCFRRHLFCSDARAHGSASATLRGGPDTRCRSGRSSLMGLRRFAVTPAAHGQY